MATVVYNVRVDKELLRRFHELAAANRRTTAEEVRIAMEERLAAEIAKRAAA